MPFLKPGEVFRLLRLLLQVLERLDEKSAGTGRWIEHRLAKLRINHGHNELDQGARSVELARVTRRIPHLPQHALVQVPESVDFVLGREVDVVDLVDDVAQEVAVDHPVDGAFEHLGDDVAAVAVGALERTQIGEKPRSLLAVWPDRFFLVDERDELGAGHTVRL